MNPPGRIFSIERCAVHDGGGIRTMVYLKGCPLRCLWCANPEGQEARSQLFFFAERCIGCGRCLSVCPTGAACRDIASRIAQDAALCRACGRCSEVCHAGARQVCGRSATVGEVMAEVLRDAAFYRRSGGGVTVSGGEPTAQTHFVCALLRECHRRGVHTALETCGHCDWPQLREIAEHVDLALYDLKHMDSAEHMRLTGVPNDTILSNLQQLVALGTVKIVVRVPVIPGCNDSPQNITALAEFVAGLPTIIGVEMLPYHGYGIGKCVRCGRAAALAPPEPPARARLEELAAIVRGRGVECAVG